MSRTLAIDAVYALLEREELAGAATTWPLMRRRLMDEPTQGRVVVVTEDGGPSPEVLADVGLGDSAARDSGVQVAVRGDPWDGDGSAAKVQAIFTALHGRTNVTVEGTTFVRIQAQSEPLFAGYDRLGRPLHTISFLLLTLGV